MTKLAERPFMEVSDVDSQFEGKWVLMAQNDKTKYFEEGFVIAISEKTDENFIILADMLAFELENKGFVHLAHVDTGESFHVIFDKVTPAN